MIPVDEVDVALGICQRDNAFLLLQRKDDVQQWDKCWEFPGGKIQKNESAQQAVIREIKEETGISVKQASFFHLHHHDWKLEEKILRVHLYCFHCHLGEGEVHLETNKAYSYGWFNSESVLQSHMLEANFKIFTIFLDKQHAKAQNMG